MWIIFKVGYNQTKQCHKYIDLEGKIDEILRSKEAAAVKVEVCADKLDISFTRMNRQSHGHIIIFEFKRENPKTI